MQFETLFEFNEQEFQLKIFNDKSYVYIQIIFIEKAMIWSTIIDLNTLVEKFIFLQGCFLEPEQLAEYLIYQVSNGDFKLETVDEESKILNMIFWVQKQNDDEIEQYEFLFSLLIDDGVIEKNEEGNEKELIDTNQQYQKENEGN